MSGYVRTFEYLHELQNAKFELQCLVNQRKFESYQLFVEGGQTYEIHLYILELLKFGFRDELNKRHRKLEGRYLCMN